MVQDPGDQGSDPHLLARGRGVRADRAGLVTATFAVLVAGLAVAFVFARTVDFGPDAGDIAVWTVVHEFLHRGQLLYTDVWDHKDWGFFAITSPFYEAWSVAGLYVFGFLSTLGYACGVFLMVRSIMSRASSLIVAGATVAAYVSLPSFLSVYTENCAIGLAVLALGLSLRRPFVAGLVFALSCSVKVSGVALLVMVFGVYVATGLVSRDADGKRRDRRWISLLAGFAIGAATLLFLAWQQGALSGWIDVIGYNAEYADINRGRPLELADGLRLVMDASRQPGLALAAAGLAAALVVLIVIATPRRPSPGAEHRGRGRPRLGSITPLIGALAMTAGAVAVMVVQYPPRFQHYQYLAGPLLAAVAVALAILLTAATNDFGKLSGAIGLIATAGLLALMWNGQTNPVERLRSSVSAWLSLNEGGRLYAVAGHLQAGMRITIYGANRERLDLRAAPAGTQLACPHFYQFPWLLGRYGNGIGNCLSTGVDIVFWSDDATFDGAEYEQMRRAVWTTLHSEFSQCAVTDDVYRVFAASSSLCP